MVMAWIAKVDGPGPDARLQYYLELSKLGDTWLNCKEGGLCVDNCKKRSTWHGRVAIANQYHTHQVEDLDLSFQMESLQIGHTRMASCLAWVLGHFNVFVPLFASLTPRYWLKSPPPMSTSMLAKDVCHEDDKYGEWCQSLAPWPHHHGQGILTIHIMHGQGHHMNGQGWITSCMARELVEQLWQLLAS